MASWHYEQDGQSAGPVSEDDLRRLAATGAVTPATRVWTDGMGDWQAAGTALPTLFGAASPASASMGGSATGPAYGAPQTPPVAPAVYDAPGPGAMGSSPYGTPAGMPYGGPVQIENQLVKSILVTLFCCLPFGIVAILKAVEANNKAAVGDAAGAQASNAEASKWIKYGVIGGLVTYGLYFLLVVAGGITAGLAGT